MKSERLHIHDKNGVVSIAFPHFEATGMVNHGFSTKRGGISSGTYSTMNLSKTRGDNEFCVEENFNRFSKAIDVTTDSLVFSDQIHESVVRKVSKEDCGKGFERTSDIIGVDGLMTNEPGVTLTTFYADCVPLFFLDPVKSVIALSHAGWRGTVKGIGPKTVEAMEVAYDCDPANILVGIGPSIGVCCYEVSEDVIKAFQNRLNHDIIYKVAKPVNGQKQTIRQYDSDETTSVKEGKYMLDLWEANRALLIEAGIDPSHITTTDLCTKCNSEDFYSHRVMGNDRGSLAAMLALK